jgi:hypothetical protein
MMCCETMFFEDVDYVFKYKLTTCLRTCPIFGFLFKCGCLDFYVITHTTPKKRNEQTMMRCE